MLSENCLLKYNFKNYVKYITRISCIALAISSFFSQKKAFLFFILKKLKKKLKNNLSKGYL